MDPRELLTDLSDPAAFPDGGKDVEVVQTHVSLVFLTGDRAYKVKKTVNLWGLIDYSTPEKRRFYCDEEIRLNRRTAGGLLIGVAAMFGLLWLGQIATVATTGVLPPAARSRPASVGWDRRRPSRRLGSRRSGSHRGTS